MRTAQLLYPHSELHWFARQPLSLSVKVSKSAVPDGCCALQLFTQMFVLQALTQSASASHSELAWHTMHCCAQWLFMQLSQVLFDKS